MPQPSPSGVRFRWESTTQTHERGERERVAGPPAARLECRGSTRGPLPRGAPRRRAASPAARRALRRTAARCAPPPARSAARARGPSRARSPRAAHGGMRRGHVRGGPAPATSSATVTTMTAPAHPEPDECQKDSPGPRTAEAPCREERGVWRCRTARTKSRRGETSFPRRDVPAPPRRLRPRQRRAVRRAGRSAAAPPSAGGARAARARDAPRGSFQRRRASQSGVTSREGSTRRRPADTESATEASSITQAGVVHCRRRRTASRVARPTEPSRSIGGARALPNTRSHAPCNRGRGDAQRPDLLGLERRRPLHRDHRTEDPHHQERPVIHRQQCRAAERREDPGEPGAEPEDHRGREEEEKRTPQTRDLPIRGGPPRRDAHDGCSQPRSSRA
jgi:hypothetical protein